MLTLSERLDKIPYLLKGEPEILQSLIKNLPENPVILEIGTFRGFSAIVMAKARKDVQIITIDPHCGVKTTNVYSCEKNALENISKSGLVSQIKHIPLSSKEFETSLKFDMIFIDGNHSFKWVSHDYFKFLPNIKERGIIAFHDCDINHQDVLSFCQALGKSGKLYKSICVFKK